MQDPTQYVHDQIAALCPIVGVSLGSFSDTTTWAFTPTPAATLAQEQAAQAWIAGFNIGQWQSQQSAIQSAQATYLAAISAGLSITSTSTPALNSIYGVDTNSENKLAAIVTKISAGLGLPGGGATMQYPSISGNFVAVNPAQITAIAAAVGNYIYALDVTLQTIQNGGSATWPTATATIP
ncbi:MAG: hypothetical protein JO269_09685 [Burkholderiaceae bacterium]|nr:hypothetical protein [Burkholderiaceae bacterium]